VDRNWSPFTRGVIGPLRVKSGRSIASALSPLHIQEKTFTGEVSESGACHKERHSHCHPPLGALLTAFSTSV